jgi:hypothetical protein
MEEIILSHAKNATISIQDLMAHFRKNNLNYMIIGSTQVVLNVHPKPKSLDVWIRNHENARAYANTCQSVSKVITQLIKHESFSLGLRKCPESSKMCKALVFCDKKSNDEIVKFNKV